MHKISFIIPSYNSFKTIPRTLESISQLSVFGSILEVIVVDSSDDTQTRPILRSYDQLQLTLIELSQKTSPASARNAGAAIASGEILCFIDSDVFLDKYWLEHILQAYAVGCPAGGGSIGVPYFQKKNFLALAQLYLQFNESLETGKIRPMALVPSCSMFVDRKLFNQVGGFPEIRASEDVLFCLKFAQVGQIWFVPQAHCFHIFREEKKPFFQNQIVLGKHIIIYRRMFYKKWYYKNPWGTMFLPLFLAIKILRITGRIINAGHIHVKRYILSFPLFMAGLFYWAVGFYEGAQVINLPKED